MRRKRRIGAMLVLTALIIMLLPVPEADAASSASDFVIRGETLKKYKGTEKNVVVPSTVEIIGEGAFQENTTVERIQLPDSVKKIEAYAFWGCDNLGTVILGGGLKEVGDMAFMNCTGLKYMTIPKSVRNIGIQSFAYCERLEDITIPPEVTDIREDSFDGDYLLNIHCEAGSYADRYAKEFYERQKEMPVYQKPAESSPADGSGTQDPGGSGSSGNAGENNSGNGSGSQIIAGDLLGSTHVVANQAVVFMQGTGSHVMSGDSGSEGAPEQTEDAAPPSRVPERAFYRNESLGEVEVAESILEIGAFAYARSSLNRLTLPQGLEKIDYAAFYYCKNLEQVELPDTLTEVGAKAFAHTAWVENFLNDADGSAQEQPFLISGGVLAAYRGGEEEVAVPDGVRVIAGEAFADHAELRKVVLPESVQFIGDRAFANCNLEAVEYAGEALSAEVLEEYVSLQENSAAPVRESGFRWTWGLAGVLLLLGGFCILSRQKGV